MVHKKKRHATFNLTLPHCSCIAGFTSSPTQLPSVRSYKPISYYAVSDHDHEMYIYAQIELLVDGNKYAILANADFLHALSVHRYAALIPCFFLQLLSIA